jgi:hypothetical protein
MGRHDRGVTTTYLWGEKKCYWLNAPPTESETRVVLCSPFRPTGSTSPYPVLVMVVIVKYLPSQHSGISSTGAQNTLRMSPKAHTGMLHRQTTSHVLHEGAGCTLWGTSATVHSRGQHSTCHHLQGHKIPMPQGVSIRARDVGVGAVLGQPVVVPCLNSPHAQEVPAAHTKSTHTHSTGARRWTRTQTWTHKHGSGYPFLRGCAGFLPTNTIPTATQPQPVWRAHSPHTRQQVDHQRCTDD